MTEFSFLGELSF